MVKLSVVIPCYPPHQKYLPFMIDQLNKQERKPDEILIGHSEMTEEGASVLKADLSALTETPLTVIATETKARASVNRNNAILYSTGDYIVCLDADDFYSSHLLETIDRVIASHEPDAIMYSFGDDTLPTPPENLTIIDSSTLFENTWPTGERDIFEEMSYKSCPTLKAGKLPHSNFGGLHGHIVIKREVWESLPQPDVPGREDSIYCRDILWNWHQQGRQTSGFLYLYHSLIIYKYHEKLNKVNEATDSTKNAEV